MRVANRLIRLLAAAVVMFGGMPAWQHSHAGGNRPHDHSAADDHDHDCLAQSHTHLHGSLFGVEVTLPVDSDDHDSDQGQPTFLFAAPASVESGQTHSQFVALAPPSLDICGPLQTVPTFRCKTAIAAPLSDNARHERSGVQLI